MNLKTILKAAFGIFAVGNQTDISRRELKATLPPADRPTKAFYEISPEEVKVIVRRTNYARSHVNPPATRMQKVTWNFQMQEMLDAFVQTVSADWWFERDQDGIKFRGFNLMKYNPFNRLYPDWEFLIHDGCQSDGKGVQRIFQMRAIIQRHCFKYSNCNATGWVNNPGHINRFTSCAKDPNYPRLSNLPCSWSWQYLPPLLLENTTEIACMLVNAPGPNAAGGFRPNHFFCYRNNATEQVNERPYKAGKSGSECRGKVKKKLCV